MLNVMVTGASRGIGLAISLRLAAAGYRVLGVSRTTSPDFVAAQDKARTAGIGAIEHIAFDLAQIEQIHDLVRDARKAFGSLHGLINNAGASFGTRRLSADGIEMTWAVNHLAPFLLTNLLLKALKAGAPARIVTVASDLQRPLHLDDLVRAKGYVARDVYGESKLANILFTFELARRLAGSLDADNPKGRLQELIQPLHGNAALRYQVAQVAGADHDREYEATVFINDRPAGTGRGKSKKHAEEAAAKAALSGPLPE